MEKKIPELDREAKQFDKVIKKGKLSWIKKRNKMSHLKPKKKKRK